LLSDVVLKDTYLNDFLSKLETNYPLKPNTLVLREIDFTDSNGQHVALEDFQEEILNFLDDIAQSRFVDQVSTPKSLHWLPKLIDFYHLNATAKAEADTDTEDVDTIPADLFYGTLRLWFLSPEGANDLPNFVCKNVTTGIDTLTCAAADGVKIKIVASSTPVFFNDIVTDKDYVDAINDLRDIADNSLSQKLSNGEDIDPRPLFFSGSLFRYWQQYTNIQDIMLKAVGYSMLGVFGAIFVFQFNLLSAILVGCMLLATTIQLYGFMYILDIKLNGFSLLNLATAVGLGVELSAYVSYSYLRHNAMTDDPDERMKLAVAEMFAPMFQGSMTGFIAVIVLNFTKYPFFGLYYFQMVSMMILLAFINGIWFLPIILSIVNPIGLGKKSRMKSLGVGEHGDKFVDDGL
jgi:hypothetical protein